MNKDKFDGFTVNLFFDEYGEYSAHFGDTTHYLKVGASVS